MLRNLLPFVALLYAVSMLYFSGTTAAPQQVVPANQRINESTHQLKYDAIEQTSRRKLPPRDTRSEDRVLKIEHRDRLNSVSRDARRNNLLGAWLIRKNQDFVSDIIIRVGGKDDGLKQTLDDLIDHHTARGNFDVAGRFDLSAFLRIMEGARTLEGDMGVLKLKSGHVQGVEADCIRDPKDAGILQENWHNGVRVDPQGGRHLQYAVWRHNRHGGFEFDKFVSASNLHLHGYFDRINQVRGISPLTTALNALSYIYDLREFIHAKARLAALLGFKFTRALTDDVDGDEQGIGPTAYADANTDDLDEAVDEKAKARIKFEEGIASINLDAGEDVNIIESETPPTELLNFMRFDVMLCMIALDIPFHFLDPSAVNFHGGKSAMQLYERSAKQKQRSNIEFVRHWLNWRLREDIIAGRLTLPSGRTIADLPIDIWGRGVPAFDREKDLRADLMAISAGIDTPQDIAQQNDADFYDNIDQTAAALEYARQKLEPLGMRLNFDRPALTPTLKADADTDV